MGDARRSALRDAVELTEYQFNAHGVELGYRYSGPAIVEDAVPAQAPARDPELYYEATTRPGARVPHARLEQSDGTVVSTIDLVDGLGFALLTGPGGEGWGVAAEEVAARTGVPIAVHVIGRGETSTHSDPYTEWARLSEVESTGCILIRPDRHVGWRAARFDADSAADLTAVVDRILALATPVEVKAPAAEPVVAAQ